MTRDEMVALVKAKRAEWMDTYDDIDDEGLVDLLVDSLMVPVRGSTARAAIEQVEGIPHLEKNGSVVPHVLRVYFFGHSGPVSP